MLHVWGFSLVELQLHGEFGGEAITLFFFGFWWKLLNELVVLAYFVVLLIELLEFGRCCSDHNGMCFAY